MFDITPGAAANPDSCADPDWLCRPIVPFICSSQMQMFAMAGHGIVCVHNYSVTEEHSFVLVSQDVISRPASIAGTTGAPALMYEFFQSA